MKKIIVLLISCLILSACSQRVQSSQKYSLFDPVENGSKDINEIAQCLKDIAGVPYKIETKGLYVPENELDTAAEHCD